MTSDKKTVQRLLDEAGRTYADEAGIRLTNSPSPLYRLLVLSVLLSTRIRADIAVAAARELAKAGCTTARRTLDTTWQQRVDALGRAHYVRYDESTATALGEGAQLLLDEYRGDLRRLREEADGKVSEIRELLQKTPRLGPVGADIFCREAQRVWPELRPYLDRRALKGARSLGLPGTPERLAGLVDQADLARLSAALVRVTLDDAVADRVKAGGGG
ncbi:endonuclease [Saccharothrix sp.]|uniref:endonuclease n=1 Tax=Saccharothrix sp. TaxID=1873460 RepID=UPI002810D7EF|nr:endonuclease [Saccharothrix sp.]